jgi:hypothetical protein
MLLILLSNQCLMSSLNQFQSCLVLGLDFRDKSVVLFLKSWYLKFVPLVSCTTFFTQSRDICGIVLLVVSNSLLVRNLALLQVCLELNVPCSLLFVQLFQFLLKSTELISDLNTMGLLLIFEIISVFSSQSTDISIFCIKLGNVVLLLYQSFLGKCFDCLVVIPP